VEDGQSKKSEFYAKLEELNRVKKEADALRQGAIHELLKQRKEITAQLRQLGYEAEQPTVVEPKTNGQTNGITPEFGDELFPSMGPRQPRRKPLKQGRQAADRTCPVCEIPGHDLRAHRGQINKRRFSEAELREKGIHPEDQ